MAGVEQSYHGNPNLKPIGYQHDFTKEEFEEFVKCEQDPIYFIENYCQIVTLDKGLQPFKPVSYTHLTLPTNREV